MLTARAEMADRLDGFDAGIDDYMLKPFEPSELIARIRAILRRASGASYNILQVGKLMIDPRQRIAQADGVALELAPKEFDLLHLLASHPGQVLARATLLERIWGYSSDISTRTVDVHIQRLREKLAVHPECAQAIATEWGVGYRMVA
jgi:DNA-binding response OmpR family regulator